MTSDAAVKFVQDGQHVTEIHLHTETSHFSRAKERAVAHVEDGDPSFFCSEYQKCHLWKKKDITMRYD